MADKKISQLPPASTPLAGTEVLPIVQAGVTDQVSIANITAGRVPAMNNVATGFTATTSAAGTTTLTATSNHIQRLTGSAAQTYKLPDATTMTAGTAFLFDNDSTGLLTVVDNASGAVTTVPSNSIQYVYLMTNATAAGTWGKYSWTYGGGALSITAAKSASITNSLTLSGTDSTTMTFPSTSATIARTDAANTFTGTQTLSSNPVLSAGTANGVVYLDGSKVATTGAVFSFDGYTPTVNYATNQIGYAAKGNASGTNIDAGSSRGGVVQLYNLNSTDNNCSAIEFYNSNSLTSGYIVGKNTSHSGRTGSIVFGVANGGAPAEKMQLYASGGVSLGGSNTDPGAYNLQLVSGNLVIGTSGKGIDFSATPQPAGMTSELLADYEEGTWTPVFTDNANGQAGQTYSSQLGTYTKVGRVVTANFSIALSAVGTWGGGVIRLSGLPYVAADYKGILSTGYWGGLASNAIAISGTTYTNYGFCDLYITTAAATGMSGFAVGYLGNSSRIDGVVTYTV